MHQHAQNEYFAKAKDKLYYDCYIVRRVYSYNIIRTSRSTYYEFAYSHICLKAYVRSPFTPFSFVPKRLYYTQRIIFVKNMLIELGALCAHESIIIVVYNRRRLHYKLPNFFSRDWCCLYRWKCTCLFSLKLHVY